MQKILLKTFLFIGLINSAYAGLPKQHLVPGGIALIEVPLDTLQATYNNKRVYLTKHNNKKYAIVGIPLKIEDKLDNNSSIEKIKIKTSKNKLEKTFQVTKTSYPTSRITIKNKQMVKPNKNNLKKILSDQKLIITSYNSYNNYQKIDNNHNLLFEKPTKGIASSSFGSRRIINNIKKNPHKGMDIAAAVGSPILTPLPGKVILAKNLFLPGNTVVIDHGKGLKTLYAHLDKINVKPNQFVKKNFKIGTVGNTGRVTGPHLHWSVILNGEAVNPSLFLMKQKS